MSAPENQDQKSHQPAPQHPVAAAVEPTAAEWVEKTKTEAGRREIIERLIDGGANIATRKMTPQFVWIDTEALQEIVAIVHYAYVETVSAYPQDVLNLLPPIHVLEYDGAQSLNTLKKEEFFRAFERARSIEKVRIFFNFQRAGQSMQAVDVGLDDWSEDKKNYFKSQSNSIVVQGKNSVWVGDVLNRIAVVLKRAETNFSLYHSWAIELGLQITVVALFLIASVRLSQTLGTNLSAETRVYIFIFFFLLFSNIWTHLSATIVKWRGHAFPIVRVSKARPISYGKAIAITSSVALTLVTTAVITGLQMLASWLHP